MAICPSNPENIRAAARLIREGHIVAFPTETVYGLGANALDAAAVARIYEAKGRPSTSPLIVHVASTEMAQSIVREWPDGATTLARRFWPGPLTLVLPKSTAVPGNVTAGLDTVGVRIPAHSVALALIREAGVPVAAPSANRFTEVSPSRAQHVERALGGRVRMILDGGAAEVGIESTVLSLISGKAVLLRPGMVSRDELEDAIGRIEIGHDTGPGPHASPGQHPRHYSPRTPVYLLDEGQPLPPGRGAYLELSEDPRTCAASLYTKLHELDAQGWDWIAARRPPDAPEWAAIRDRLERASFK